jgi:hypothetical protein
MVSSETPSECGAAASSANPLPLFREQAVAAQGQKVYGEIVRIRLFSTVFLTVLTIFVALIIFGFLCWAHYTGQAHLSGMLSPGHNDRELLAVLHIPARTMRILPRGAHLLVRFSPGRMSARTAQSTQLNLANIALGMRIQSLQPLLTAPRCLFLETTRCGLTRKSSLLFERPTSSGV